MVALVVVMVSPHPMGPSGCKEMKEDREVAKGGEKQWPDAAGLLRGKGNGGNTRQVGLYLQGCIIRQTFTQIHVYSHQMF